MGFILFVIVVLLLGMKEVRDSIREIVLLLPRLVVAMANRLIAWVKAETKDIQLPKKKEGSKAK